MRNKSMTRVQHGVSLLLLAAAGVACVPFPRQYFLPEGAGGQLRFTPCNPKDVPDSIEFALGAGMMLDVKVAAVTDGRNYLQVRFLVPGGKVVKVTSNKVAFSWAGRRPRSEAVFDMISLADGAIIGMSRPEYQQYLRPIDEPVAGRRYFWLATYIAPQPDGDFSVTLPPITVNGLATALPEIHFRKGPFSVIAPLNC